MCDINTQKLNILYIKFTINIAISSKYEHKLWQNKANWKEISFCFVFVNLWGKFILCYFAYASVASKNHKYCT